MTEREQPPCCDAADLILADLCAQQSRRRRHFLPALVVAMIAIGGPMLIVGVRPDLLAQPAWQLALQCLLWLLCLIVFPAIGLGLVFPGRATRIALAGGAVGLALLATLGVPAGLGSADHGHSGTACSLLVVFYALAVLVMGLLSGAFVQRRRASAVYWIAAGISLTALSAITWQCPETGVAHVLPSHLAVAAGLMIATSVVGILAHRRRARGSAR
jgi:drug/metabolite transporter (DMT)-like permease